MNEKTAHHSFLALGGNIGDRAWFLNRAIERLRAEPGLRVLRVSSYYETPAVGGPPDSPPYLNAVAEVETSLSPEELLGLCLAIERTYGRVRSERNAPRTLDLDVLLYDDLIRKSEDPILPHPRMHERRFVLAPLVEFAPDTIHPELGKSARELLAALPEESSFTLIRSNEERRGFASLIGKKAFVAGSTSGIGKAIAAELERAGAKVIRHGRREISSEECPLYIRGDLSTIAEQDRVVDEALSALSGIDIWVHNAGVDTLTGEAAKWPFERKLQTLLDVDLVACMRMTRRVGEAMKSGNGGSILTIGWDQAEKGMEGDSGQLFCAVKGAIHSFTRSLAKSLAPSVRVNGIAPGWIRTAWGNTASTSWQDRVRRESLLQRWGLPEEIARMARFLVSEEASYINGQMIEVNGGAL